MASSTKIPFLLAVLLLLSVAFPEGRWCEDGGDWEEDEVCILEHVAIVIVKAGGEVGVATKTVVELGGEGVMMTAEGVGSVEAVEIGVYEGS
uniref:Uncharacterized protein n=1 Tax=Oryza barthii TaxID=65489 RepID=A0A0D3GF53_9ORYZ